MTRRAYYAWSVALSAGGTLFAGYLSAVKILSGTCAFNEPCPYFLGYPSCWYGFGMFVILLVLALVGLLRAKETSKGLLAVSILGTVFAGSFVVQEALAWMAAGHVSLYGFGLPTCVYGLVFYVLLLVLATLRLTKKGSA